MARAERLFWVLLVIVLAVALLLLQCRPHAGSPLPGAPVELEPADSRPVFQTAVADSDEAALLRQKFGLEIVRYEPGRLYFHADETVLTRLPEFGYAVSQADPYEVGQRVVRVGKKGDRAALDRFGVRFINEEAAYWVVRGSLADLRSMRNAGYALGAVEGDEPRPRQVRVTVKSREDIHRVAALHVDIYTVTGLPAAQPGDPDAPLRQPEKTGPIQVHGAAFDRQIELLRELDFEVEILPDPEE